jgi:AAA domain/RepB DNA-primase N-terminal domain
LDTVQFLQRVWTERASWVDIPSKINGHWIPWSVEWPDPEMAAVRVASALADGEDIYFSPAQFSSRGRRYEDVLPTYWLWADLDEVHPQTCVKLGVGPTMAWQSSPGRYQALWELDHPCSPRGIEQLNRRLTYATGADKSGWDLTQVLRVPGTRNFKYTGGPVVEICLTSDEIYHPKALARKLASIRPTQLREATARSLVRRDPVVSTRAQVLLRAGERDVVEGERSAQLWKLECELLEGGHSEEQVYELVVETPWNKHKEVQTGERQLRREIAKAARHVGSNGQGHAPGVGSTVSVVPERGPVPAPSNLRERSSSPFVAYGDFLSANLEAPRWLVKELWTAKSHGIFGGEPKSMKSVLSLALGMSVASGKPFLADARFPAGKGKVLIVQEENDPWRMQDLMRKMAKFYGLIGEGEITSESAGKDVVARRLSKISFPKELDLFLLNNYGFDMTAEEHRDMLEEEIKARDPALLILDPLYLMIGGADVNVSQQLAPFFKWLIHLKFTYGCAILVNHHFRKQTSQGPIVRPGQRVLGTTTLHAWVASALYAENTTTEDAGKNCVSVRMEREFRNVGPRRALDIRLMMGDPGDMRFEADIEGYDAIGELVRLVQQEDGCSASLAAERLQIDKRTVISRARSTDKIRIETGKRGRGNVTRLWYVST